MKAATLATTGSPLSHRFRQSLAGLLWAALAVSIFSGWFVITRFSVTRELRIWDITALRFGIGALLLAPVLVRRRSALSLSAWLEGLVFAVLWGVPFVLLVAFGLSLTSAAHAAAIAPTMMPVFAGIFAWTVLTERQGWRRWVGYAAISSGLCALVWAASVNHGPPDLLGLAALAVAAAMWAIYTLKFRKSGLTPIEAAALICFWSAIGFLPAYLLLGLSRLSHASTGEVALQAVYQGVLMSGVAIFTFNRAVSMLGASAATAIIALIPAVAALLAIPVLGEIPTWAEWTAIATIVMGVLLASGRAASVQQSTRGRRP